MTEKKKIIINRDFLSLTKKKKKPKWHKPKLNTNSLKKKLLNKIKKYKNDQKFQNPQIHNEIISKTLEKKSIIQPKLVDENFKSTLETMDNIIKQQKEKKRLKKEKKRLKKRKRLQRKLQNKLNNKINNELNQDKSLNIDKIIADIKDISSIKIITEIENKDTNEIINNEPNIKFEFNQNNKQNNKNNLNKKQCIRLPPPWGCLKNGKKPTFKQYKKSLKMKKEKINIGNILGKNQLNNITFDNSANGNCEKKIKENIEIRKNKLENFKNKTKRLTKTMKRWKLGKRNNYVGVLIKSKKIRKMINNDIKKIRKTPVNQAKKYLYKRNLLKQGSQAPNDIVKLIYENSLLAGDIYNINPETLLHNFINAIN